MKSRICRNCFCSVTLISWNILAFPTWIDKLVLQKEQTRTPKTKMNKVPYIKRFVSPPITIQLCRPSETAFRILYCLQSVQLPAMSFVVLALSGAFLFLFPVASHEPQEGHAWLTHRLFFRNL